MAKESMDSLELVKQKTEQREFNWQLWLQILYLVVAITMTISTLMILVGSLLGSYIAGSVTFELLPIFYVGVGFLVVSTIIALVIYYLRMSYEGTGDGKTEQEDSVKKVLTK